MRKTLIHFFTIADYEEEEIWLRNQHKNGWRIVNMIPPCFYVFESCEPQDIIYRLDYKNSDQNQEYMQIVKDFGWEYFMQRLGWLYFRKPADEIESEDEGELFSDNESRVDMVRKIVNTRLIPTATIFLCCLMPNLPNAVFKNTGVFIDLFVVLFWIIFVIYVFLIVYCSVKLKKIRDKYKS